MPVVSLGIDLAKSVFQVHGVDASGYAVLRRRLGRSEVLVFFARLSPCLVGMEACSSAHHWARELARLGHDVRLIPPQYVKPYVKRNKTDAADAEAICEAVTRPNMRFVPVKTREQQAILALHRVRSLLVRQRTASINAVRGLLSEFGLVAGKGSSRVVELRRRVEGMEPDLLPQEARAAIDSLFNHIDALQEQIKTVEDEILAWHKTSEESQRLASAPGVGPMTATAIVAAVGDGHQFRSARHFAAWLGLTPRITASGSKERIGRISEGGDRYLRTLVIHGARGGRRHDVPQERQASPLASRSGRSQTGERGAHKMARALWAMLTRAETYHRPTEYAAAA